MMAGSVILPRISEKAVGLAESNVYVFDVPLGANKVEIAQAVARQFKVKVVSVNIAKVRGKPKQMRTRRSLVPGRRADTKHAYVRLASGDSIKLFEGSS